MNPDGTIEETRDADTEASRSDRAPRRAGGSDPQPCRDRSWAASLWYLMVHCAAVPAFLAAGGIRVVGRRSFPRRGGVLLVANHLSFLDVFVLGVSCPRPLNYMARSTLFVPPLGALIRSVGGFAIQREGIGASGLKETLRRLRSGGVVVVFPEGTRSPDGTLGSLKPGLAALATRARVPIVPAAIAGTFEAWPRSRLLPRPHPIRVHYGPPIPADEVAAATPDALLDEIRTRILACQAAALERAAATRTDCRWRWGRI